jgi:tRNA(Ile)-lysidine synthase
MNRSKRSPLEQSVLEGIRRARMLGAGDRVCVGVSGGADSIALLLLLERLRDELGVTLVVAHFNHLLRGEESEADAEFVARLAQDHGLEIMTGREDVLAESKRQGWNLEEAARKMRYAFFAGLIAEGKATRVAVAHTADDQAETVLAHIFRGTGLTGLGGIYPVAGGVVRPLLGTRREELREYLRAAGQAWREDSTNGDTRRMRARIREQLLPVLARDFSPAIVEHMNELSRFAREEGIFWDALVEDRFQALARREGSALRITVQGLLQPLNLQTTETQKQSSAKSNDCLPLRMLTERLIRRLYEGVRGNRRGLGANHVEQVMRLAGESANGRSAELPGGVTVRREFGELIFWHGSMIEQISSEKKGRQGSDYRYVVSLPLREAATVSIPELGKRFRLKVIDWPGTQSDTKRDANTLDADLLRSPLILRNWRPGDAYRPHGRRDERKVKSYFLVGRVPSRERAGWPVLESDGRVIWARGMAPAEDCCAGDRTRVGVVIEEEGLEAGYVG